MQVIPSSLAVSQRIIPGTPTPQRDTHMIAMYSAFVMDGLHENDYDAVLSAWNGGCVELVCGIMDFVPYLVDGINAVASSCGDDLEYPGVPEYEMAAPFGMWIAQMLKSSGSLPAPDACRAWLDNAIVEFFGKFQSAARVEQIKAAVAAHATTSAATSH